MSTPSLKVVVAITSPIAFSTLKNSSIIQMSIDAAENFVKNHVEAHLAIAGSLEELDRLDEFNGEKIVCNPNNPSDLAQALQQAASFELLMIHDSQRPLTQQAQFERVYGAITSDIDAVRPVSPFTETLKSINSKNFIDETIDRNSMMRVSTPQLIRSTAIDFNAKTSTWFVPLKASAKTSTVEADPDSARINSEKEIELMAYLLDWNK